MDSRQVGELDRIDGEPMGVRVEKISQDSNIADSRRDPEHDD